MIVFVEPGDGTEPDGKKVSTQGCLPYEVQYVEGPGAKDFAKKPTKWATGVPTVYNADTLGIRPDKFEKIETWADLLNAKFKGKTAITRTGPPCILQRWRAWAVPHHLRAGQGSFGPPPVVLSI